MGLELRECLSRSDTTALSSVWTFPYQGIVRESSGNLLGKPHARCDAVPQPVMKKSCKRKTNQISGDHESMTAVSIPEGPPWSAEGLSHTGPHSTLVVALGRLPRSHTLLVPNENPPSIVSKAAPQPVHYHSALGTVGALAHI